MPAELWDVYDKDRNKTGRTHKRGVPLTRGEYHMVVDVWVRNREGQYLISKRAPHIRMGGQWQCTCGSALSGDTSLQAAIREANEELGLVLDPSKGRFLFETRRVYDNGHGMFFDVWFFEHTIDIKDVVLQEGETVEAKWATPAEILEMYKSGIFMRGVNYLEKLFTLTENDKTKTI